MCIIIAAPFNKEINRLTLYNCWKNNPDGAGLMYVKNEIIKIVKELKNFDKFYNLYKKHYNKSLISKSPIVLHFRIKTHGLINYNNTHPFRINKGTAFCHNGIITIETKGDNSDTVQFNNNYLKKLPIDFYKNEAIVALIEDKIITDRIAILTKDREVIILNKVMWEYDETLGIYYSNKSYLETNNTTMVYHQCYNQWEGHEAQHQYINKKTDKHDLIKSTFSTALFTTINNPNECQYCSTILCEPNGVCYVCQLQLNEMMGEQYV